MENEKNGEINGSIVFSIRELVTLLLVLGSYLEQLSCSSAI